MPNKYVAGCSEGCKEFDTISDAQTECDKLLDCSGITIAPGGKPQLRSGEAADSPLNETSYVITNSLDCHNIIPDPIWKQRGEAAYMGVNRTDPDAIWSFQGWAIIGWNTAAQASAFRGFVAAVPQDKFVVIDMSTDGDGEWKKWNNAAFYGAPFIWTTLHDFGGTDGMKGKLPHINQIPFAAQTPSIPTSVWGTGYTPEGIDQNPVYYEFMAQQNFRAAPVDNIPALVNLRSQKRYGLIAPNMYITEAWNLLVNSSYSQDLSVQDDSGVPHLPGYATQFQNDRVTPTFTLCQTFNAWTKLIQAVDAEGSHVDTSIETFRYDMVNLGRELLAQLATPMSMNFSNNYLAKVINLKKLTDAGTLYIQILQDIDTLVATNDAFLLGPWLEMAKFWGASSSDCGDKSCPAFYEWNARVQLTTWNPTSATDIKIPGGPIDYASKHWSGLISDYYAGRAEIVLKQALSDQAAGQPLDLKKKDLLLANHAYNWQNLRNPYPLTPVGDAVDVARNMYGKYMSYYCTCDDSC